MRFQDNPKLGVLLVAIMGMVAGIAAKQSDVIYGGRWPKGRELFADILVLGMVLIIVMYVYTIRPMPYEGVALLAGSLAMWGPKGIAALVSRFRKGALVAAQQAAKTILDPPGADPAAAGDATNDQLFGSRIHDYSAQVGPVRQLRTDLLPGKLPTDQQALLGKLDNVPSVEDDSNGGLNG